MENTISKKQAKKEADVLYKYLVGKKPGFRKSNIYKIISAIFTFIIIIGGLFYLYYLFGENNYNKNDYSDSLFINIKKTFENKIINVENYYIGIEDFNNKHYHSALNNFKSIDLNSPLYKKAQEFILIIKDTLSKINNNTIFLFEYINNYIHLNKIDHSILFDSLISHEIISVFDVLDYYNGNIKNK